MMTKILEVAMEIDLDAAPARWVIWTFASVCYILNKQRPN
jgi:hypothetical protein